MYARTAALLDPQLKTSGLKHYQTFVYEGGGGGACTSNVWLDFGRMLAVWNDSVQLNSRRCDSLQHPYPFSYCSLDPCGSDLESG